MKKLFELCVLGCVFLFVACAGPKKTKSPLLSPVHAATKDSLDSILASQEILKDSLKRLLHAASADTVVEHKQQNYPPNSSIELFQNLTPEQVTTQLYATGIHRDYSFAPTIHYDLRKPQFVIIHHTSQNSTAQTIRTFQLKHTEVSSHYVIGRDGQIVQMLNDYMRSWHAGAGKWGNITDMNSVSVGIELDNNGREPFSEPQIQSLMSLLDTLKTKYRIPQQNFIGHSDYAPGRKDDPSTFFPWERLAQRGFGIWYNTSFLAEPPSAFNASDALRIIGYDTRNMNRAIQAFKKKFIRNDTTPVLTPYDRKVLFDLYLKYY